MAREARGARSASTGRLASLLTERPNPRSGDLDRMSSRAIAALMNREDRRAVAAVGREARAIARAVDLVVEALRAGGRLFFVGAGTSGRLGVLEAAECPPTFGTPPRLVQGIMAGGRRAVFRSREGAEDDERAARAALQTRRIGAGDVVVGVSASGITPFVRAALDEARRRSAGTVLVACNPNSVSRRPSGRASRRAAIADVVVTPAPGPEVLAGSTRLKAGTATKLVLNTLTTASMARLGNVYGNRMVDLQPRSLKLRERAIRLVAEIGGVSRVRARRLLEAARWRARTAIVMARCEVDAREAARLLGTTGGALRPLIDRSRAKVPRSRSRKAAGLRADTAMSGARVRPSPQRARP